MTEPVLAAPAQDLADALAGAQRVVVKVGSSLLVDDGGAPSPVFASVAKLIAARDAPAALVSSGAVALGRARLGVGSPTTLDEKQACAAAGQPVLMAAWAQAFSAHDRAVAQALVTLEDTERRRRWLNARATLERLMGWGAIPVINENDTTATDEIRYGDNDRLAARVAQMLSADVLILLSDVDGLYDADPRANTAARRLAVVARIDAGVRAMAGGTGSAHGSGGMRSKIEAAEIATAAGCGVLLTNGRDPDPVARALAGASGTWFVPRTSPQAARRAWIAHHLDPQGAVRLDAGAATALAGGASVLPIGVTGVDGRFEKGDAVRVLGPDGAELGRGLAGYGAGEARRILGLRSDAAAQTLGYAGPRALIHRNDFVLSKPDVDRP